MQDEGRPRRLRATPPFDPAIDVNLFEYAIGPKTFFTVADANVNAPRQLTFDFLVTYLRNPFTIYNVDDDDDVIIDERLDVVESMLAGDLSAAYGLNDRIQLGASLPIVFQMAGDGLDPSTAMATADGLKVTGTGDLSLELKAKVWRKDAIELAGAVGGTLPSSFGSGESQFIGDDLPSLRGRFIGQWTGADGKLALGGNLGLAFRKPRTIYASTVGEQLTWNLGAAYRATETFSVVGEAFGRTGLEGLDLDASPLEVIGGARVRATKAVAVVVGGGAGVVQGIGSPDLRVFASVGWAPDTRDTDGASRYFNNCSTGQHVDGMDTLRNDASTGRCGRAGRASAPLAGTSVGPSLYPSPLAHGLGAAFSSGG